MLIARILAVLCILSVASVQAEDRQQCMPIDYHAIISMDQIDSMWLDVQLDREKKETFFLVAGNGVRDQEDITFMYSFVQSDTACKVENMFTYASNSTQV